MCVTISFPGANKLIVITPSVSKQTTISRSKNTFGKNVEIFYLFLYFKVNRKHTVQNTKIAINLFQRSF